MPLPATIAELRATGFPDRSVKQELRANLLERLGSGAPLFPQVVGFGDSVLPVLERGLLAGHDLVMLGEPGKGVFGAGDRLRRDAGPGRIDADRLAVRVDQVDRVAQ